MAKTLAPVVETLLRRLEENGYVTTEGLDDGDALVVHAGGQDIQLLAIAGDPTSVIVTSTGDWRIFMHKPGAWGCTLHPDGLTVVSHRIAVGLRLVIDAVYTPPIDRITLRRAGEELHIAPVPDDDPSQ